MGSSKRDQLQRELDAIVQALQNFPNGASIEKLRESVGFAIEPRTLQRRLSLLLEQNRVRTSGVTKGKQYHFVAINNDAASTLPYSEKSIDEWKPSKKGQTLLVAVRRPLSQREAVSYNFSFLEAYKPNISFYLSDAERQSLAQIGETTAGEQPAGTYARQILNRLLIDLSWNSSRLEGNTYSLLDTQRLLMDGKAASDKTAREAQMILNHKEAIEFLVQNADDIGFNRYTIQNLHALLSDNLLGDPAASGRLRTFGVGITGSVYTPLSIPQQLQEVFDSFLQKAGAIKDPFEQSFFCMVHLPYLQPFDDVNKRVSRLAANIPLNRHNLSPLSFTDVPQDLYVAGLLGVYEKNDVSLLKDVFIHAYQRSAARYAALRQTLGEPDPFRLKHREQIRTLIRQIMAEALPKQQASVRINAAAETLPSADRQRFVEAVETELLGLHEGNFGRYGIRPSQYQEWKTIWEHH